MPCDRKGPEERWRAATAPAFGEVSSATYHGCGRWRELTLLVTCSCS